MTAPTSDERREVAERLREALGGHVAVECSKVAHALGLEYETHGMMYCFGSEEVRRLADLIDPTCHLWPSHDGGFGCDRCFTWFPEMKAKTSYCPACGARVVDDEQIQEQRDGKCVGENRRDGRAERRVQRCRICTWVRPRRTVLRLRISWHAGLPDGGQGQRKVHGLLLLKRKEMR